MVDDPADDGGDGGQLNGRAHPRRQHFACPSEALIRRQPRHCGDRDGGGEEYGQDQAEPGVAIASAARRNTQQRASPSNCGARPRLVLNFCPGLRVLQSESGAKDHTTLTRFVVEHLFVT